MGMIYVKPKPGTTIKHFTQKKFEPPLPPEGGWWPDDQFTARVLRDGATSPHGVVLADPPPSPKADPAPAAGAMANSATDSGKPAKSAA